LAQEGAKIGAPGRDRDELEVVVHEIQGQGGEAIALAADISQAMEMKQAIDQLVQR